MFISRLRYALFCYINCCSVCLALAAVGFDVLPGSALERCHRRFRMRY